MLSCNYPSVLWVFTYMPATLEKPPRASEQCWDDVTSMKCTFEDGTIINAKQRSLVKVRKNLEREQEKTAKGASDNEQPPTVQDVTPEAENSKIYDWSYWENFINGLFPEMEQRVALVQSMGVAILGGVVIIVILAVVPSLRKKNFR